MSVVMVSDHDPVIVAKLQKRLEEDGYRVIAVSDPNRIVSVAREEQPDLLVLDMQFPSVNSLILCNELRNLPHLTHIPVLFMSNETSDAVDALDAGGDDLIVKPVDFEVVAARVRALLRRSKRVNRLHSLQIDTLSKQVWVNDELVSLTPTEFNLLEYLCEYKHHYHTASELLEKVWHYPPGTGDTALIRNHVHNLRTKLENVPNRPQIIVSLHGRGYRVNANINHLSTQDAASGF